MPSLLEAEDRRYLAPEMLLDPSNPANDPYFRTLDNLRALAVLHSTRMKPRHVQVARLTHQSVAPKDQAKRLKCSQAAVYTARQRPDVQELVRILQHMGHHVEGPNLAVRKNMLWRIAASNEKKDPSVAIQAVKELNKIDGAYPVSAPPQITSVNVTINEKTLPRTKLDE